ncbi:MAG: N-acetyl sugar amidotransferase, partial [bacterium]
FGRTSHLCAIDLRNGRIDKEEAKKLINEYDGKRPESLDGFLEYLGITEEEFNNMIKPHVVKPWIFPC